MKKTVKIFLPLAFISLLAASCSNKTAVTKPANEPVSNSSQVSQNPNIITKTVGQATRPSYKAGYIVVSQTVDGSNLNGPYLQLLKGATAQDSLTISHNVVYKTYGSMGDFVESIDGTASDSKHFWELFVNGKSSNVGMSSYILKDGDQIEWKLSAVNSSGQ